MFKFLRSRAKQLYWFIAIAFVVGFIFLAAADLSGGRRGDRTSAEIVGSVGGSPITVREWDLAFQNYLARMRQQNPDLELTTNQRASVAEQVWQYFLHDRVEQKEIQRLGLTATPDEILDILKNNPPAELLAQYRGPDGNPDLKAYLADLANPNRDWTGVENYIRSTLPRQKLQLMIASRAVVSEAELREAWVRQEGRAVAEWMGVLLADLPAAPTPTEEAIRAYYEDNRGRFERPARARVRFVSWPKEPGEGDRAEVRQLALDIKREIESGLTSFEEATAIHSADPSRDKGGDLGTFDRHRMVAPFTAAAFSLPVGRISDPVETQFGYHLIEVLEQFAEGGEVKQVHARHILFKVEAGDATLNALSARADEFVQEADKLGFDRAAQAAALTPQSPAPVSPNQDIPGLPGSQLGSQFALQAKAGQHSGVLETDEVLYVVALDEKLPRGPAPLDEVRSQVVSELHQQQQKEEATRRLAPALELVRGGASMADAAQRSGVLHAVTDTFTATANIARVGFGTAFNLVALQTEPLQLVPRVETPRGVFALRTLWKQPLAEQAYLAARESLRAQLMNRRQMEALEAWYQEQLAGVDIVDNRAALGRAGA